MKFICIIFLLADVDGLAHGTRAYFDSWLDHTGIRDNNQLLKLLTISFFSL